MSLLSFLLNLRVLDPTFTINFPGIFLPPWRPGSFGPDSLMGLYRVPAEPSDVAGHRFPCCCVCQFSYVILEAELQTNRINTELRFTDEMPDHTGASLFSNPAPPSCVCIPISFHLFTLLSPHSGRVRGHGLKSRYSPHVLCGSLDALSSSGMFLISWLWLSMMNEEVPCCSSLLMLIKPFILEFPKCDGEGTSPRIKCYLVCITEKEKFQ